MSRLHPPVASPRSQSGPNISGNTFPVPGRATGLADFGRQGPFLSERAVVPASPSCLRDTAADKAASSPPLAFGGPVGGIGLVERVEFGPILIRQGEVEDLRVLRIRSRWIDLEMTGRPCCRRQRSSTCAGVRPTRCAMLVTVLIGEVSAGPQGAVGLQRDALPPTRVSSARRYCSGLNCTWLTVGRIVPAAITPSSSLALKLETPTDRAYLSSRARSIPGHANPALQPVDHVQVDLAEAEPPSGLSDRD